ncbi:bifunctional protein-disulfide isomerase/oxidoreductase DsbC [Idiomarina xiamenensis]|uniref:Thiol:disulfide interchange protein n=1 Tax=Idiomarina xiamenensis 10-D-4 TaxID=740709 RepID=K2KQU7_9GAMM|nr:bifunctional protein-disulfide isomerase/oxidoreductase DsbC [Idiomarina xiamenensis]EKE84829.1 protein-disulfide isomerase [Idiomarina xiamenensis 10-D-4]
MTLFAGIRRVLFASGLVSSLLFATPLVAASLAAADEVNTEALTRLGMQVEAVAESRIAGLFQITTDKGMFYLSKDGKTLVNGRLYDVSGQQPVDLTDMAMGAMRVRELAPLEDEMIVYKAADERHVITVFTDTTCGYCRRMHQQLDDYLALGISVRYMAYPRGGMGSEGARTLAQVWCSEDRKAALTQAKHDQHLAAGRCDDPVAKHYQLGQKFGIQGTPAVVLENGMIIPGYQPPKTLLTTINDALSASQSEGR